MSYRSIAVKVVNSIHDENLILIDKSSEEGKWSDNPESIMHDSEGYFKVKSLDGSLQGVEGKVVWQSGVTLQNFKIYFKKPQSDDPTTFDVTVPDGYTYVQSGDTGGHDSDVGVTFLKK